MDFRFYHLVAGKWWRCPRCNKRQKIWGPAMWTPDEGWGVVGCKECGYHVTVVEQNGRLIFREMTKEERDIFVRSLLKSLEHFQDKDYVFAIWVE